MQEILQQPELCHFPLFTCTVHGLILRLHLQPFPSSYTEAWPCSNGHSARARPPTRKVLLHCRSGHLTSNATTLTRARRRAAPTQNASGRCAPDRPANRPLPPWRPRGAFDPRQVRASQPQEATPGHPPHALLPTRLSHTDTEDLAPPVSLRGPFAQLRFAPNSVPGAGGGHQAQSARTTVSPIPKWASSKWCFICFQIHRLRGNKTMTEKSTSSM